jgi:hypothetical protein
MKKKHRSGNGAFGSHREGLLIDGAPHPEYVYHFTDTARLPWILESGELRVHRADLAADIPTKFLWVTRLQTGDKTCAALSPRTVEAFRKGWSLLVRFTLHAHDFEPWFNMRTDPLWAPYWFDKLESKGKRMGGINEAVDGATRTAPSQAGCLHRD